MSKDSWTLTFEFRCAKHKMGLDVKQDEDVFEITPCEKCIEDARGTGWAEHEKYFIEKHLEPVLSGAIETIMKSIKRGVK